MSEVKVIISLNRTPVKTIQAKESWGGPSNLVYLLLMPIGRHFMVID
jgi:hypothetical protein